MASPLIGLPVELLLNVTGNLNTQDLCSLRLTCKIIEESLHDDFVREFFTRRQFMLTYPSLQALVEISEHSEFSNVLKHVVLGTDRYDSHDQFRGAPTSDQERNEFYKYSQGRAEQDALLENGGARQLLTKAFRNLPALHTVSVRDTNSRGRHRDGHRTMCRSYGAPTVERETGSCLKMTSTFHFLNYQSTVFRTLLFALCDAESRPENIQVFLRNGPVGLSAEAFLFPQYMQLAMEPLLAGLKTLLLAVADLSSPSVSRHHPGTAVERQFHSDTFKRFLRACPNLTHLRINLQSMHTPEDFFEWLIGCNGWDSDQKLPCPSQRVPSPEFPHLETLDFGLVVLNPAVVLHSLKRFPTVTSVSLWKVALRPAKPSDPKELQYNVDRNLWQWLIQQLAKSNLQHVMIGYVSESMPNHRIHHVRFQHAGDGSAVRMIPAVAEYRGSEIQAYLTALVKRLMPRDVPAGNALEVHSDTDMDGDEDDEDEEEEVDDEAEGEEYDEDAEEYDADDAIDGDGDN